MLRVLKLSRALFLTKCFHEDVGFFDDADVAVVPHRIGNIRFTKKVTRVLQVDMLI